MMDDGGAVLAAGVFAQGLIFGSFASAMSWRIPRGQALVNDRSRCPACGHVLGPPDLVPLLSWLVLRGRCRHCRAAISWRYPLIELITALLFTAVWALGLPLAQTLLLDALALGVVILTVTDLEDYMIPDVVLLALLPVAVAWRWLGDGDWLDAGLGCAAAGLLGALLHYGSAWLRGEPGLGFGDVKLLALAGILLGLSGLTSFLLIAGMAGVALGLLWRLAGLGPVFPFGPALAGAMLAQVMVPALGRVLAAW